MPVAMLRQPTRLVSLSDVDESSILYPNELITDENTGDLYLNKSTGARVYIKNVSPKTTTLKDADGNVLGTILPETEKDITLPDATDAVKGLMTPEHIQNIGDIEQSLTEHVSTAATSDTSGHVKMSNLTPNAPASTGSVGTSSLAARADHIHPIQTSVSGNAGTATKLATARTINLSGVTATGASFDGSGNITIAVTAVPSSLITGLSIPSAGTTNPVIAGTATPGVATTWSRSDHVHPAQTTITGNAGTATKLATARTIGLSGVTATAQSFNGSANITIPITAIPVGLITGLSIPAAGTTAPLVAGTASAGTATTWSRSDHVHPVQTSVSGNAGTATRLATARTIGITGVTATAQSFNGSANISIPITAVPASLISGIISIDNLPAGALERMVVVEDKAARFALTTDDVQVGDTVKEQDTGLMYYVKDQTKLSSEDGYEIYTAGSASSVPWGGVTGKPVFATVATSGSYSDLINLPSIPAAGTTAPIVAGTASAGSAATWSRSDHVHPVQTSVSGNAGTATRLATARTIGLSGVTATAQSFNGSANITIPITAVPASLITGLSIPAASDDDPIIAGTASAGTATTWSRSDHVHPVQTSVSGNAGTATRLANARSIGITGVTASSVSFDGSANVSIAITAVPVGLITGLNIPTASTTTPAAAGTAAVGTSANYARADHVHPIQTTVSGNAGTATKLATARTITLSGVTDTGASFDGSGNATIAVTAVPVGLITGLSIPAAGTATPAAAGTADAGTSSAYAREDHVHPVQTSVSGNAGTATTLATARTIGLSGVTATAQSFNGSTNITIPITAVPASLITGLSIPSAGTASPVKTGRGASVVGTSTAYAREDHAHGNPYGVCTTAAATAAKVVSCGITSMETGTTVLVKFSYTNTYTGSATTLNVDGLGAYEIRWENLSYSMYGSLKANQIYEFCFDGNYWVVVSGAIENTYQVAIDTASWTSHSDGYFYKTFTVYGVNSSDNPIIDLIPSSTYATAKTQMDAYSLIFRITTSDNAITVYTTAALTVALTLQVKVVR